MNIVITGAGGQLANALVEVLNGIHQVYALSKTELNVSNIDNFVQIAKDLKPEVIIHTAAFTDVDGCESNPDLAYRVNALGARNAALAAQAVRAKLIHVSTDYVFDGTKGAPYVESDLTSPINVYGSSKRLGEQFVQMICDRSFIVRTSWLYGETGNHFITKIKRVLLEKGEARIINDQFGSPTYTRDLAMWLGMLMETDLYGTYHGVNEGYCSRYEFTVMLSKLANWKSVRLDPVPATQFKTLAQRPVNSALKNEAAERLSLPLMRDWQQALSDFIHRDGGNKK